MQKATTNPVESTETTAPMLTRRRLLKTGAGAAAGGAILSGADAGPLDLDAISPTGEAEAIPPVVVYGGLAAITWTLHEVTYDHGDTPPDGLGPDALQTTIYQDALKTKSHNKSTFIDNQNIVEYIPESAFSEGKLAALESIQNGATESEAINDGQAAANAQFATIESNLLKSWNESITEADNMHSTADSHADLDPSNVIKIYPGENSSTSWGILTAEVTLRDGTTFDVKGFDSGWDSFPIEPTSPGSREPMNVRVMSIDGSTLDYLDVHAWGPLWNDLQSTFDNVNNNISTWVSNVYSQIQSGEISPTEYLSATDFANTIAADSANAQAIGNLLAMNVPGDYGQEATVDLLNDGATVKGYVATTDTTNVSSISTGDQFDPAATDTNGNDLYGTWYLAFRPGTYIETWDAYDDTYGIQGGSLRFTSDPTVDDDGSPMGTAVEYSIETAAGETATAFADAFTEETIDGTTYWTTDVSGQLDTAITDISRVRVVYSGDSPDAYQTMILDQPFKITEIEGDASSLDVQQNRDPQTDNNYITDAEWQQLVDQQQELIDRFEEAPSGGGGADWSDDIPDLGILPDAIPGNKYLEWFGVVVLGLLGVNVVNNVAN